LWVLPGAFEEQVMMAVSARRRTQRGNTVLDSALCFLPMMAMFFGIIDVCYAVSIQSLFSQAVRAGSRFAVTYSANYGATSCASSQAACVAKVVQDNAVGFLAGTKINAIGINYYISNNLTTPVMSCTAAGVCTPSGSPTLPYTYTVATTSGTTSVTITYANQPGNIVEVTIPSYPMLWMVPIKGSSAGSSVTDLSGKTGLGLTLTASSADVLGGLQVGTNIPPAP
jgi:Flp pilus assembly protein TadG